MRRFGLTAFLAAAGLLAAPAGAVAPSYLLFESGPVRPLAMSPDQTKLFAVNTPDNHLEIFSIAGNGTLTRIGTVQVGMEPVAVAARTNDEVWVVNQLSDSVSIVKLTPTPHVENTLLVGDEPQDVVFAGTPDGQGFFPRAFITAAHRGQNHTRGTGHTDPEGQFNTAGVSRADVWVFNATGLGTALGGTPLAVIGLFGDKPRALAATPDGTKVYAAVFHSGNQSTALSEGVVCDTSASNVTNEVVEPTCTLNSQTIPGGLPLPHKSQDGNAQPETGLIVQFNRNGASSNHWLDELGRNWDAIVKFSLPDRDVFEIDADAPTPAAVNGSATCANGAGCWAHVGTVLFNMIVKSDGKIYVSNTDAQNQTRFEGPGTIAGGLKPAGEPPTVQGNLAQARITVLDGANVNPRHLNKHLDYSIRPAPAADKAKSLATPTAMAIDGSTLYVAAFGSQAIGVFDTAQLEGNTFTPSASSHIPLTGGGPAGLVVRNGLLYVLTRFDDSVAVMNPGTNPPQVQKLALHTPEPADVIEGRPFLYDAQLTSSNGEASCSSCHIFGDMDDLAWDLGNPDDNQVANNNPFDPKVPPGLPKVYHPIKGPMTTQSLRGLVFQGPEHWRGDRQSNGDLVIDETDSTLAFEAFNVAFPGLVGRDSQFSAADMTKFRKFAMHLTYPPNPMRQLTNLLRSSPDEASGAALFVGKVTDIVTNCNGCHTLDPASGFFGSDGQITFEGETQHFKVPHLRNEYQKVGMFGVANNGATDGPFTNQGNQIRGFGFLHDGSMDTLFRFHSSAVFTLTNTEQTQLEAFMMVFDSDLAPIVGQQITLTSTNSAGAGPRIDLLKARAQVNFTSKLLGGTVKECDLIAKVVESGVEHGFLFDPTALLFDPDDGSAGISDATLRNKALVNGNPVTFTCAPPGSGHRMALDRDEDQLLDGVETNTGVFVNPQNTGSNPALADTDGDGYADGIEVLAGFDPNDPDSNPGSGVTPPPVPSLGPFGLAALATLMGVAASERLRRRGRN
jgi:6-phosphogluconolactonase (cycloisomerase 2 family)